MGEAASPESRRSRSSGGGAGRLRPAFICSFSAQAASAVVLAHALVLPLLYAGSLSGPGFALVSLVLSCAALTLLGRRWARSIASMRATLQLFGVSDEKTARSEAHSPGLEGLQRSMESVHRRVARRVQKLKAARAAAELDASNQRTLARQLTRAQRMARVGGWEWDRSSDAVVCSG